MTNKRRGHGKRRRVCPAGCHCVCHEAGGDGGNLEHPGLPCHGKWLWQLLDLMAGRAS